MVLPGRFPMGEVGNSYNIFRRAGETRTLSLHDAMQCALARPGRPRIEVLRLRRFIPRGATGCAELKIEINKMYWCIILRERTRAAKSYPFAAPPWKKMTPQQPLDVLFFCVCSPSTASWRSSCLSDDFFVSLSRRICK